MKGTVHIVDDNLAARNLTRDLCRAIGMSPCSWRNSIEFLSKAGQILHEDDVLILDVYMPDKDAVDVLRQMALSGKLIQVVLVSGKSAESLRLVGSLATALGHKVVDCIAKPLKVESLQAAFSRLGLREVEGRMK